jgi:hypothetical protein
MGDFMLSKDPLLINLDTKKIKGIWLLRDTSANLLYDPFRKCWMHDDGVKRVIFENIASLGLNTINLMRRHYLKTYHEFKLLGRNIEVATSDVGKSKWQIEYEQFPVDLRFKAIKAQIPVLLSDEILLQAIVSYKESTVPDLIIDLDYARVVISAITIRYSYKKYNYKRLSKKHFGEHIFNRGWVQIKWEDFKTLATREFEHYLNALIAAEIVLCDGLHWHFHGAKPGANKARCYKINDAYYDNEQLHYYVEYTNYRIKTRLLKYKYQLRNKSHSVDEYYQQLMSDVELLFGQIDEQQIKDYYEKNIYQFYDVTNDAELQARLVEPGNITLNEFVEHVKVIKENYHYYYNVCDDFGGRFHSIMTNTTAKIRRFIAHRDTNYVHMDIKNSQMVMLSALITQPNEVKKILSKHTITINNESKPLFGYYESLLQDANIDMNALQGFCDDAKAGVMYDKMAAVSEISRNDAKLDAMKIIFSNNTQYRQLKDKYSVLYPELIKLCDALNCEKEIHLIPKLTQLIESEIFINRVVRELYKYKKYPVITIHDSVMIHPDDVAIFNQCYNRVFQQIGIKPFIMKKESCTL